MLRESRRFATFLVYTVAFLLALRAFAGAAPQERELRGRVVFQGEPVAWATVRLLERKRAPPLEDRFDSEDAWEHEWELFAVLEPCQATMSSSDGTFVLRDVASGELRLELEGRDGARAVLDPLPVHFAPYCDLGDLELAPGASLEGSVLLPADVDPSTVRLACSSAHASPCTPSRSSWWGWTVHADVRADGTFRFDGTPAGDAWVTLAEPDGIPRPTATFVQLAPGETERVELDLWVDKPVTPRVVVLANGAPAPGVRVDLVGANGRFQSLGRTGRDGVAAAEVIAVGRATALLRAPSGLRLAWRADALDLAWRTEPEARFELLCGAFEVEWPPLAPGERLDHVRIEAGCGELYAFAFAGAAGRDARVLDERRARFDWVPPGELDWTIAVRAFGADGRLREGREYARRLAIRPDETTRCVLNESDRVVRR